MSVVTSILPANGLSSDFERDEIVQRVVRARRAPTANDRKYPSGTNWVDKVGAEAYILIGISSGNAVWKQIT